MRSHTRIKTNSLSRPMSDPNILFFGDSKWKTWKSANNNNDKHKINDISFGSLKFFLTWIGLNSTFLTNIFLRRMWQKVEEEENKLKVFSQIRKNNCLLVSWLRFSLSNFCINSINQYNLDNCIWNCVNGQNKNRKYSN